MAMVRPKCQYTSSKVPLRPAVAAWHRGITGYHQVTTYLHTDRVFAEHFGDLKAKLLDAIIAVDVRPLCGLFAAAFVRGVRC